MTIDRQILEYDKEMAEQEALDAEHYDATHAGEPERTALETEMDVEDEEEQQDDRREELGREHVEKQ